jgi:hypothetical protein
MMRAPLVGSMLAVAVAAAVFSSETFAQGSRTPDLSGIWVRAEGYGRSFNAKETPPMQPWAAERYAEVRKGITNPAQQGRDDLDPVVSNCAPVGMPRIMVFPRAFEIIPTPGRLLMIFEWDHTVRQILIGQKPPADPDPIWMGYSTGKWDRDTLVVDTVGLTDQTWLDSVGHPHSDALHVTERIHRVGADTLEIDFTFDDPRAYTAPWTGKVGYTRMPEWQLLEHFACENRDLYGDALLKGTSDTGANPK